LIVERNYPDVKFLPGIVAISFSRCLLYADGEITREEYLQRRTQAQGDIARWETVNIDTERTFAEVAMAIAAVDKIKRLWDTRADQDRQGLARLLFERIIYDLDKGQIEGFKLKTWDEQFFTLRTALIQVS
jgi:hypothetical protein